MADMDMIPRSYREALRVRRTLFAYGAALAVVLAGGAAAAGWLHWRLAAEGSRLDALRAASASAESIRGRISAARQHRQALVQASEALAALRASGTVARLSDSLDGALNERVWFTQLRFSRSHELLPAAPPGPLAHGTLLTRGAGAANGAVEYWRLGSNVEIAGQASDHAALAQFLGALGADPALAGVRFLNSTAGSGEDGAALSFSVAGPLPAGGGQP